MIRLLATAVIGLLFVGIGLIALSALARYLDRREPQ